VSGTVTFGTPVNAFPGSTTIFINAGGTCVDSAILNPVSFTFGTGPGTDVSCSTGLATLGGSATFGGLIPPQGALTATYTGGPFSIHLTVVGNLFYAAADLAWTNGSAACALGGTLSVPVSGTFTFVNA
jgi:hypothetical protein